MTQIGKMGAPAGYELDARMALLQSDSQAKLDGFGWIGQDI